MTAASTWAAHITAVRNMERVKDLEAKKKWAFDARVHLSAHFQAVEIEAAEGGDHSVARLLDAAGGIRAWIDSNPWDHRPINRYRWENKKRKARF
jgi:hypothetical protein